MPIFNVLRPFDIPQIGPGREWEQDVLNYLIGIDRPEDIQKIYQIARAWIHPDE